jgi:hypothetical protein
MPQPLSTPGKDPVPIVKEAGWNPGPGWTGAENLVPRCIRSPNHPTRSQSTPDVLVTSPIAQPEDGPTVGPKRVAVIHILH